MRILTAILIGLLLAFGALYLSLYSLEVLPRLALAPGWSLTDEAGRRLTSEDVRGEIVVYSFTHWGSEHRERMPEAILFDLQQSLYLRQPAPIPVRLLTISLDERDSTIILAEMAHRAGADAEVWHFVRGDSTVLENAVRYGFGVSLERGGDGTYDVDPMFVVADGTGVVRARYRSRVPTADQLYADIESLTREAAAASGTARLAYQAAHLFSCYTRSDS